jgi:F-type H+-transporting ATPase subunit delta
MKIELKAKQYAEALFNVSVQSSSEKAVRSSLRMVNDAIKASPEFRAFLFSKRITEIQKASAVKEAFGVNCHPIVSEFIGLVTDQNLVKLFSLIEKSYIKIFEHKLNFLFVIAHVSSELSERESEELKESLESVLGKSMDLSVKTDPNLIGGIKLRVGNKFMDASIQSQLENMRQSLLKV